MPGENIKGSVPINNLPLSTMDLIHFLSQNIMSLWQKTTTTGLDPAASKFQSWHYFDPAEKWIPVRSNDTSQPAEAKKENPSNLVLATWNIDAFALQPKERIAEIINVITGLNPTVDIIFLQEVSKAALEQILQDERIQSCWFSSERDKTSWGGHQFATMTLVSKARFGSTSDPGISNGLGPIWRVKSPWYPSRFDRDALCCDVFIASPQESEPSPTMIRLVNVHLDSLPSNDSRRPVQLSLVASSLREAGRGLVAGDFNPVQEEDATLVEDNHLEDAWKSLRSDQPGFTWGVDGTAPFPPNRLDKIALLGLTPHTIDILEPKNLAKLDHSQSQEGKQTEEIPWSDHHGLVCSFGLPAK